MTDPQELVGETLSVHLNLTRGDYVLKGAPKGPVLAYARTVTLEVVTFKVSEPQRLYCVAKGPAGSTRGP